MRYFNAHRSQVLFPVFASAVSSICEIALASMMDSMKFCESQNPLSLRIYDVSMMWLTCGLARICAWKQ